MWDIVRLGLTTGAQISVCKVLLIYLVDEVVLVTTVVS